VLEVEMKQNDGGPAFPNDKTEWNHDRQHFEVMSSGGMTLRDYFAAKALTMLLHDLDAEVLAGRAYQVADAMLAEREK
jgi:hypothetical protein